MRRHRVLLQTLVRLPAAPRPPRTRCVRALGNGCYETVAGETVLDPSLFHRISIIRAGTEPVFPRSYGVAERDAYYNSLSVNGAFGGSAGHDSTIIAYDALLGAGGRWEEFVRR